VGTAGAPREAAGHPRLIVRAADVPRLRAWARSSNPVYARGLRLLALRARKAMDDGDVPSKDNGSSAYTEYPTELYAELFAFMSLVDPAPAARADWGRRARTLLMHVIDRAAEGPAGDEDAFRAPNFATFDRSRWQGEAFGLTVDWAYPYFDAGDKAKVRKVFERWTREQFSAYPLTELDEGTKPTLGGRPRNPRLLTNRKSRRWSLNNYFIAHTRNMGLMALALDPADDPGGRLRRFVRDVTGQWLFQTDHALRRDGAGGLSPEGFEYGPDAIGRLSQLLLALQTAGADDPREAKFAANPFWRRTVPAFLSSLPGRSERPRGENAYLGQVFRPAFYGDGQKYWVEDPIPLFGPLGLNAARRGDRRTLAAARWIVRNVSPGGESGMLDRIARTDEFFNSILYFLLLDPAAPRPADPRPRQPLTHVTPGTGRLLARTCWCPDARLFTYALPWNTIDHQRGEGNDFGLNRKGEWLTKQRVGYNGPFTDYHNTLTVLNDHPDHDDAEDPRFIGWQRGTQWAHDPSGDPRLIARERGRGYTYALGDATNLYNSDYELSRDVRHVSRSIVWLEPDRVVVYDRAETGKADRFKRFWLQLPAPARIDGRRATVRTPGGQQLFVTSLAPEAASLRSEPAEGEVDQPAVDEPMQHRLRVEAEGAPRSARFLHVLEGADGGARPSAATEISSSAGTPFTGAAIAGTAVLFPVTVGAPATSTTVTLPPGVDRVLVTGLRPRAGYTATRSGDELRITLGGGRRATAGGVLDV
jgi:hypothetical protein